jgi:hypothetical protein
VLETYREVLRDVLDLPSLAELLRDLHSRKLSLVEVETPTASPFASSLLFDYVATYMYEGDTPNAERRAAALALDRDLLRELLGQEELRELIDPGRSRTSRRSSSTAPRRARPATATPRSRCCATSGSHRRRVRGARQRGLLGGLDAGEAGHERSSRSGQDQRRGAHIAVEDAGVSATPSGYPRPPACRRAS